ncbi:MAG: esterase-like activity of phytase family protein [Acidobacteriota bacterium]
MRRTHWLTVTGLCLVLVLSLAGCRSIEVSDPSEREGGGPWWDVERAEVLLWEADDPSFAQNMALEGSGLVAHDGMLLGAAEKYAHLLRIDPVTLKVRTFLMDLPQYAEIEGVTVDGREILLCDEANAAVWATDLPDENSDAGLEVRRLELLGLQLSGGKLGVEGIAVDEGPPHEVFLALERHGSEDEGCRATIFKLNRQGNQLAPRGAPLVIPMEDCNWRLTGLQFWNGRLLALKTRYPGERYEVVVIDRETGNLTTVLDMTELLMRVQDEGWGNNIEGVTVTEDGALWLISDNAMTDRAKGPKPPPGRHKTLLMRIPPLHLPRTH